MADIGHEETDALLSEIEKKMAKEYRQAVADMQKKCDDYFRRFEARDKKWRKMVDDGLKTEKEYAEWRKGQMMTGYRWKAMRDQLAEDLHHSNVIARSIAEGYMPEAYAINHNYGTYLVENAAKIDTSYTLYDRQTVERIIRDDPDLLPPPGDRKLASIAAGKDIAWQEGQIQSVTLQGILQGESIPNMAKRISSTMGEKNYANSVRYARTAVTGAENAGRRDAYARANKMGIQTRQTWVATLDNRTRHSHAAIDGETVDADEYFSNGCRYPGDPKGPPEEIWNCRCTTIAQIKGFERDVSDLGLRNDSKLGSMSYKEWKDMHKKAME